jgi:hypothetical protein
LGDELLPRIDHRLGGLQSNGVNQDDRTVTGVPDSFVGPSPEDCLIAIEYTVQRRTIAKKFASDLRTVAQRCPRAGLVVLVSASSIDGLDLSEVYTEASNHRREVLPIGGDQLAGLLDSVRQDLRHDYLNIPIAAHSIESVRRVFAARTRDALMNGRIRREDLEIPIQRDRLTREVAIRTAQLGGTTCVHAPIGTGKSTWSYAFAMSRGETTPAIWIAASDVAWHAGIDPIAAQLTHVAYGAPSPERILDLVDLLNRAAVGLILVLDGIDEVEDYTLLARALNEFSTGAMGARTHLIATYKTNAMLNHKIPRLRSGADSKNHVVAMPIPDEHDMTTWLERCGTPHSDVRHAMSILPRDLRRPLFLRLAVDLPRDPLQSEADLAQRVVSHLSEKFATSLRVQGAGPSSSDVRGALGALAWACMKDPADTVQRSAACAIGDIWRLDGERSLVGRAEASGLIRVRPGDRLAFTHAFFQAAFAAASSPDTAAGWVDRVDALRPESRRSRLGALVDRVANPEPLLDALLTRDPMLALWCASRVAGVVSDKITEKLLPHFRAPIPGVGAGPRAIS